MGRAADKLLLHVCSQVHAYCTFSDLLHAVDPDYLEKVKKLIHVGREQKQLVDPYCTVSYGGHKVRLSSSKSERVNMTGSNIGE